MDLTKITGYRTNEDNSETLAYFVDHQGRVTHCAHDDRNPCGGCFEADQRLYRNVMGDVVRVG